MMKIKLTFLLWAALHVVGTFAQQRAPLPANLQGIPAEVVFSSDESGDAYRFRDDRRGVKRSQCTLLDDAGGAPVYDLEIFQGDRSQYSVALNFLTTAPVRKGDVLLARLTMRTLFARQETQESAVYFMFQEASSPWTKSVSTQLCCGREWKTYDIPFVAHMDLPAGKTSVELALGSLAQHVQVTGIEVLNYGHSVSLAELPETSFTYFGREEGAPWREEALARIDEIRTAPIHIEVCDSKGRPAKGAQVRVTMLRSDFIWGTAVNEGALASEDSLSSIYKSRLKQYFNTAIIENGFKAGGWFWEVDRKCNTLKAFQWLQANGFRQRGHNLVWPGWKFNPRSTRLIAEQGDSLRFARFIRGQFYERMAYTKGSVIAWDVVNELMHERDFFDVISEDEVVEWFKLAKRLDPDAQLFINEYGMLNGAQSPVNIAEYIAKIETLKAKGAPIEAVGIQGHIGTQPRSPIQVLSDLDLFRPLGLPVQITEFDINTTDESLQADYTRDFLIAVYSHPVITGVNLWGFWERHHWKPAAAMFRKDWTPKPNAAVWEELVLGAWHTHFDAQTDRRGVCERRGHLGEYRLEVTYKGETRVSSFKLGSSGAECLVQF